MMAPTGTPVIAPMSGHVTHGSDPLGGLSYHLTADNGWYMFGAHLVSYGASGRVEAGTVIGYVGETGNAQGAHLHYEIHIGGTAVNPFPYVASAC
jgi:peptidoglycan LD-endopeptidase LytH